MYSNQLVSGNNLDEQLNWLNKNKASILAGFSDHHFSPEPAPTQFKFYDNPPKFFPVMKYLPVQGKSISDFLPGYQDDGPTERSVQPKVYPRNNQASFGNAPSNVALPRTEPFSGTPNPAPTNYSLNYHNNASEKECAPFTATGGHSIDLSQEDASPRLPSESNLAMRVDSPLKKIINPPPNFQAANLVSSHISSPLKDFTNKSQANDSRRKWQSEDYPWSPSIYDVLLNSFGYHQWRENQKEIINATMSDKDVFVTMPTGGGKSLCYQIPAACTDGLSIVISPLISLIEDQVMIAKNVDLPVNYMSGKQAKEEFMEVWRDISSPNPRTRLLFVTPEKLAASTSFMDRLVQLDRMKKLKRFVIDEAHCVSQWGHDFRKDYCKLSILKENFPGVPILAMTATATQKAKLDIIQTLRMSNCEVFSQSFNRTNLWYEVRKKTKTALNDIIAEINTKHRGKCGIIYCLSQADCEKVAQKLQEKGLSAAYYHAGEGNEERSEKQSEWSKGKTKIVVATIAFGMGINKADVRFVIHYCMPKSLEGYYQESGRAGRDGKRSDCILYYCVKDKQRLRTIMQKGFEENHTSMQVRKNQEEGLARVVSFCDNIVDCRRKMVLNYFGEDFDIKLCNKLCDTCAAGGHIEEKNYSDHARKLVDIVAFCEKENKLKESATSNNVRDVFRGSKTKGLKKFENCPHYGSGKDLKKEDCDRVLEKMVSMDIIREAFNVSSMGFTVTTLRSGPQSIPLKNSSIAVIVPFRRGGKAIVSAPEQSKAPNKTVIADEEDDIQVTQFDFNYSRTELLQQKLAKNRDAKSLEQILFKQLSELRATIFKEEQRINSTSSSSAERTILTDEVLHKIAKLLPRTQSEIQNIEGVGKKRANKWGSRFLNCVLDHVEKYPELNVTSNNMDVEKSPTSGATVVDISADLSSEPKKRKLQAAPFETTKKAAMQANASDSTPIPAPVANQGANRSPANLQKFAYKK